MRLTVSRRQDNFLWLGVLCHPSSPAIAGEALAHQASRGTPGLALSSLLRSSAKIFALGMVPEVKINAQNQKNPLRFENRCEILLSVS